jgi:hypothetical protein
VNSTRVLRRIRSALMLGLSWGVVWLVVGIVVAITRRLIIFPPRAIDWALLGAYAGLGIASGTTFGGLLTRFERDRTVETLAPGRLALWGILAGAGIPMVFCLIVLAILPPDVHLAPSAYGLFALLGVTGAVTAAGTLALARRDQVSAI